MDEDEFLALLKQFPVVRSRDYNENDIRLTAADVTALSGSSKLAGSSEAVLPSRAGAAVAEPVTSAPSASTSATSDKFWNLLKTKAALVVGRVQAERFCLAFKEAHKDLIEHHLSLDDIERIAAILKDQAAF